MPWSLLFECWVLSQHFHSLLSLSSRDSWVPLHFLPLKWYHLHIWSCWCFSWPSWFQLVSHPAQHFVWRTLHISSSASVRLLPFLFLIVFIFVWNVPLVSSVFLKRSLVFPILLFSSISLHYSLKKAFLAILWNSAFSWVYLSLSPLPFASPLFSAICKAYSNNHFAFLHFFCLGTVLVTTSCTVLWTPAHSY